MPNKLHFYFQCQWGMTDQKTIEKLTGMQDGQTKLEVGLTGMQDWQVQVVVWLFGKQMDLIIHIGKIGSLASGWIALDWRAYGLHAGWRRAGDTEKSYLQHILIAKVIHPCLKLYRRTPKLNFILQKLLPNPNCPVFPYILWVDPDRRVTQEDGHLPISMQPPLSSSFSST